MVTGRLQAENRAVLLFLLLVTLLPLSGISLLDWQVSEALFVYWVEFGAFIVLYSVSVLFAKREANPEERTVNPPRLPIPFVSSRAGSVRPVRWLPPIHYRNIRYATGAFVMGLVGWFFTNRLFMGLTARNVPSFASDSVRPPIERDIYIIEAAFTPEVLGVGLLLFVATLLIAHRTCFDRETYERLSAPAAAEIPFRLAVFWFLLMVFGHLVFPLVTWPLVSVFDPTTITEVGITTLVVLGNVLTAWSAYRAGQHEDTDGIARWFTPENLRSE